MGLGRGNANLKPTKEPGCSLARQGNVAKFLFADQEEIMPTWRADYFDKAKDQAPTRSIIIEAEYEFDALDAARAEMRSACSRAEVIRININSGAATY